MITPMRAAVVILFLAHAIAAPLVRAQEADQPEREAMYYRYLEFASYVKGGSLEPHWMADGSSFWYAGGAPANSVIWKFNPRAHTVFPEQPHGPYEWETVSFRYKLEAIRRHFQEHLKRDTFGRTCRQCHGPVRPSIPRGGEQ